MFIFFNLAQLTSWECYNYILRGFVEELLSFGAKEELKLMTLQVWAAYLRRMQVAFFNRKQADLPKLSVKYLQKFVWFLQIVKVFYLIQFCIILIFLVMPKLFIITPREFAKDAKVDVVTPAVLVAESRVLEIGVGIR